MEPARRLLCVDDDPEFCNYLQLLSRPYNLILKICSSVEEAKKVLEQERFDAYIVDISLGKESGLDLARWIRQTQGIEVPVAIVSGVQKEAAIFRQERENLAINYVLDKPLKPQDVRKLFDTLCQSKESAQDSEQPLLGDPAFQAIKKEYDKTIFDKLEQLEKLCKQLAASEDLESMKALCQTAHKIAGSAATYGYPGVTTECRSLEHELLKLIALKEERPEENPQEPLDLPDLEDFLREVKKSFQITSTEEPDLYLEGDSVSGGRSFAYLVSGDRRFLDAVDKNETKFALDVLTEEDPEKAIKKLSDPSFNPQLLIVDRYFQESRINGEEILDVVRKKESALLTSFGMLVDEEDLDTRVEIMQKGIKYVFHTPISPEVFLDSLHKIFMEGHVPGFKVLVIDDDPDICHYLTHILHEKGMEVKALHSGAQLFETLKSYKPNCLLLDISLPKHSGLQILKALRSDPRYATISIIIITVTQDEEVRRLAYESDVDDILYKPLDKRLVQTRIYNIAMRREQATKLLDLDPLTGLPTQRALYFYLHKQPSSTEKGGSPPLIALISLDDYDVWQSLTPEAGIDKAVVSTAYTLVHNLPRALFTAYLGHGRFAVIHDSKDSEIFIENLGSLLSRGIHEMSHYNEKLAKITYSCGIAPFPTQVKKVNSLIESVEEALKKAETIAVKTPPVTIFMEPVDEKVEKEQTEVVLIDPDLYLLEILQTSFKSQGLKTTLFTSGKAALEDLLSRPFGRHPSLIISERNLTDMEGLDVIKTLHRKQAITAPFIFLTTFSSEKEVFEGLNAGAQDYIAKPFNLKILMKKAHALLF